MVQWWTKKASTVPCGGSILKIMARINIGDVVIHELSGLYYRCENAKMSAWMSLNPYYQPVPKEKQPPPEYFKKHNNR